MTELTHERTLLSKAANLIVDDLIKFENGWRLAKQGKPKEYLLVTRKQFDTIMRTLPEPKPEQLTVNRVPLVIHD